MMEDKASAQPWFSQDSDSEDGGRPRDLSPVSPSSAKETKNTFYKMTSSYRGSKQQCLEKWVRDIPSDLDSIPKSVRTNRSKANPPDFSENRFSTYQQGFQSEAVKKNSSISLWMALFAAVLIVIAALYAYVQGDKMRDHEVDGAELRLMLVGKTGAGKSASGNTILGEEVFRVEASPASVTGYCSKTNKIVNGKNITVIDTPGVMDTWLTPDNTAYSADKCISDPAHRPHVFLLVIRLGRFTEEERYAVNWIQENFGEVALKFTILLFTGGDLLEKRPVEIFISKSEELQKLVDSCKGRYHVFNNNQRNNLTQVTGLFQKINFMMYESMGYTHANEVHQKTQKKMKFKLQEEQYENEKLKEKLEEAHMSKSWFGF